MSNQNEDREPEKKAGRAKRAAGFFARRGGLDRSFDTAKRGVDFIADVSDQLRPKRLDRDGFEGRYSDGGVQRFQDMVRNLSASQIEDQLRGWEVQRRIYYYAALFCLLGVPLGLVFLSISKFMAVGLMFMFLFSLFRSVRADFYVWIIEQGRFGGFRDYLTNRLPRNMQIILPTRRDDD